MLTVKLKIVEEGLKHPLSTLRQAIAERLLSNDIVLSDHADVELKIKFMREDSHDVVLLQQRDATSKHKINERVIRYFADTWIQDVAEHASILLGQAEYVIEDEMDRV
jgi:hypothetical protein